MLDPSLFLSAVGHSTRRTRTVLQTRCLRKISSSHPVGILRGILSRIGTHANNVEKEYESIGSHANDAEKDSRWELEVPAPK